MLLCQVSKPALVVAVASIMAGIIKGVAVATVLVRNFTAKEMSIIVELNTSSTSKLIK